MIIGDGGGDEYSSWTNDVIHHAAWLSLAHATDSCYCVAYSTIILADWNLSLKVRVHIAGLSYDCKTWRRVGNFISIAM